jgi:hypothetical protein
VSTGPTGRVSLVSPRRHAAKTFPRPDPGRTRQPAPSLGPSLCALLAAPPAPPRRLQHRRCRLSATKNEGLTAASGPFRCSERIAPGEPNRLPRVSPAQPGRSTALTDCPPGEQVELASSQPGKTENSALTGTSTATCSPPDPRSTEFPAEDVVDRSVAILQSNYIPWKGYFDLIRDVDLFIFLDDVQYTTRDWRNRNRIKTRHGLAWLTVPVGASRSRLIHEVEIANPDWGFLHWRRLLASYGSTPYFDQIRPLLEPIYLGTTWRLLSDLNQTIVRTLAGALGINTELADSRRYKVGTRKQDRILDLLSKAGATRYVTGQAARAYIDPERFARAGIDLVWKDYSKYPEYPQPFPPFEHQVTILDLMFNTGPDAAAHIWGNAIKSSERGRPSWPPSFDGDSGHRGVRGGARSEIGSATGP